jgi:brefeldin A-resistance guanine nucleotide exchange factor 1
MRIDEALRIYLSEFRLPGEAPLISALLEHFAAHWRVRNICRFGILFSK